MSKYDLDKLLEQDPSEFYEKTFQENYPRPLYSRFLGSLAVIATGCELYYPEGVGATEYLAELTDKPAIVLFNHPSKKELHDPIAALAAVKSVPDWMSRADTLRVWVKSPILAAPGVGFITERLGAQTVLRKKELPVVSTRGQWNNALCKKSQDHINKHGGSIVIFPAGTRGGTEIQAGAGRVAEGVDLSLDALIVPIVLDSKRPDDTHIPRKLKVSYGEPIVIDQPRSSDEYTELISQHMERALERIR